MKNFTKAIFTLLLFVSLAPASQAQLFKNLVNDAEKTTGIDPAKKGGGLSSGDIAEGLKQALQVGAKNATSKVSAVDGFFADAVIKVLMPSDAKKVENTLRKIGLGSQVDQLILSMNRAAEDASTKALEIFIRAVTHMSIEDGLSILNGSKDAATQYLKSKTSAELTAAFLPVIKVSLDKVQATQYWSQVFTTYNGLPTTFKKVNPDLPAYVTERALNGVFVYIAQEEEKIRTDPAARVNDLLKKVFK